MTKEQMQQKWYAYWENPNSNLDTFYGRCSENKRYAWAQCQNVKTAFGGERMRIICGNTYFFTVGFMCDYFGYNFCVITASHIYLAKIDNNVCKGVLKYA